MTEFTESTPTSQVMIPKSKGKLQNRITLLLIATLIPILLVFAWFDITSQRRNVEALILERAKATAVTGAATISHLLEQAIENGELTREAVFDRDYQAFWEFDPSTYPDFAGDTQSLTKYHTAYDAYTDEHWQELIDPYLMGEDLIFAVPVDVNGYLPTHNTRWASGDASPATDRSKRIFNDPVGIKAAQNTDPTIQQIYERPGTGETLWDISAPIYVDGEHWGAFRVGVALAANQERVIAQTQQTVGGLSLVIVLVFFFSLLMGRYVSAPIMALTTAATQTASGDLSHQITIENRQEISTLAYAFNSMTQQIRDLIGNLESRVAARTQDLNLAAEISRQITQARDVDEILRQATTSIQDQFNLYQVQIYLLDHNGENLILRASEGFAGSRILHTEHTLAIDESSLNGTAALNKEAVIVEDTQKDGRFRPYSLLPDTRSEMVVPIMLEDDILGVLDVQSSEVKGVTAEILPAFSVLAGQLAIAITNARQNRAIQENQLLMRTIIDASPDWIFVKNQDYRYQLANQAYANLFHMTPEELIGKTDLDLGFPEDIVKGNPQKGIRGFWEDDQEVMKSKQMKLFPEEQREVEGQLIVLQTAKAPLMDDEGSATGVVGFVHDITNRKQAEMIIARRAEELQAVAELSTAVAETNDPQQLIQEVVDLAKQRFSLYHVHIYLLDESGENLVLAASAGEAGAAMVSEGHSIPLHQEQSLVARAARTRDGVIVNDVTTDPGFLSHPHLPATRSEMAVPIITGRRVLGVLDLQSDVIDRFTNQDVQIQSTLTAQTAVALQNARQSQQIRAALQEADTFRRLVEETRQGVGIADTQGHVYYANQGLGNIVGKNVDDIVGNPLFGLYPTNIQAQFQQEIIPAVLAQGEWEGELRILNPQGEEIPTYENYFILPDEAGKPAYIAAIVTDISDQKATEENIRANQILLRTIIDNIPDWIVIKDLDHRFVLVNQSFADHRKLTVDDIIGKNDLELGDPEEAVLGNPETGHLGHWHEDDQVTNTGLPQTVESAITEKDGTPVYKITRKIALRDDHDHITGLMILSQDVTEIQRAHKEQAQLAREMQEQLEQVNALQRAITRKGWKAFLSNQEREATGFAFAPSVETVLPFGEDNLPEALENIPLDLDELSFNPTKTAVNIPLQLQGESIGVIGARSANGEPISEEQQALLTTLTAQVAASLDRARLFEETELGRQEIERRARELALMNETAELVARELNLERLLESVYHQLKDVMDIDAFWGQVWNEETNEMSYPLIYDKGNRYQQEPRPVDPKSETYARLYAGKTWTLIHPEEKEQDQHQANYETVGVDEIPNMSVFVPMHVGNKPVGTLSIQSYSRVFTEDEITLLEGIANHVALGIENANLFAQTELRASELAIMNEISELSSSQLNLNDLVTTVGDRLMETFSAQSVYVALVNEKTGVMEFPYFSHHTDGALNIAPRALAESGGFAAQVYQTRQPLIHHYLEKDSTASIASAGGETTEIGDASDSYIGVPMIVGEQVIGVLGLNSQKDMRIFDDSDIPLLATLARTIGVSLQNVLQFEAAQRRANREAIVNEISQKIQNAPTVERAMQTAVAELSKALNLKRAVATLNKPET